MVTQKKKYALRAVTELAKRIGDGPVKISEIAEAQAIPVRFLEVILNKLKHAGLVSSRRGFYGGYTLSRSPEDITVGMIFSLLEGRQCPHTQIPCVAQNNCPFLGDCAFMPIWSKVQDAINEVYDQTTIRDLLEDQATEPLEREVAVSA